MQLRAFAWLCFVLAVSGCASGNGPRTGGTCSSSAECMGGRCVDGRCVGGGGDGGSQTDARADGPSSTTDLGGGGTDLGGGGADLGPLCTSCDDGNACTTDTCDPATGDCTHTTTSCDDGSACTTDSCDATTGCAHATLACDDGDACTSDSCDAASGCSHTTTSCDDGNACTADTCAPASGCIHTTTSCDDGDVCTIDACNPSSGCSYTPSAACSPVSVTFPVGTDAAYTASGAGYYWVAGDYVDGSRTTTLARASGAAITLYVPGNYLSGDTCDFRMLLNGVEVGRFSVLTGAGSVGASFAFGTIPGPTYQLRYEVTRTVGSGLGSILLDFGGSSTVMLSP